MTRFSHSRVDCATKCPYKYKLKYKDKLTTLPDQEPNNALYLGLGLHKGIETTVEEGVREYLSHYYVIDDRHIAWQIQLEYWIPKVKELLPSGEHEVTVKTDDFIGYIDLLVKRKQGNEVVYDIYDFKFSNNVDGYRDSPQLSIYAHYLAKTRPNIKIGRLQYVFVPKTMIRQKRTETPMTFRQRLLSEMESKDITILEVPYMPDAVQQFQAKTAFLTEAEKGADFPKNQTRLCDWCEYKEYCHSDGKIDYMIYRRNDMTLPKNERRTASKPSKRTIWLYGRPFTGKTTLADHAPDPLMLNTDGNAVYVTAPFISIKDDVEVTGRIVKRKLAWVVFKETLDELEKKQNTFKTIVVDLLEDLYESCRLYMFDKLHITHESDDNFRAWDKVRTEFYSQIRRLMNLEYDNIILLSHEDSSRDITKKSGESTTSIRPNIQEKVATKVAGMVGLVGRVVADGDERTIEFKADDVVFGGERLKTKVVSVPLTWDALAEAFDTAEPTKN